MRIALIGAQNTGKTTLYNAFKAYWPNFTSPDKDYRTMVKEKNIPLNEEGTIESQSKIRDILVEIALDNAGKQKTIHDRCVLDSLAYTFWLHEYDKLKGSTLEIEEFVTRSIHITRECMRFYDILFWLPVNPNIPVVESESGNRSTSEVYRTEIDNIFYGIYENYKANTGLFFNKEDQPAFIPLVGPNFEPLEVDAKIDMIRQYIDVDGELVETKQSVLTDLQTAYEESALKRQVGIR